MPFRLDPVLLVGAHVRLEPLADGHLAALEAVAADSALWTYAPHRADTPGAFARYVEAARAMEAAGTARVFATCLADGTVVGATRFANASPLDDRVEIGWTFLARHAQRTGVNRDAKRAMLVHAFDTLGLERVEFKTDARNAASRAALLRLGAVEEGTLRRHTLTHTGVWRDTVYYSILRSEWPVVHAALGRVHPKKPAARRV